MMTKPKLFLVWFLLAPVILSCATFTQNTYRTMYTAGTTYDVAMTTVSSLQKQGVISTEQRAEINKIANIFYGSYQLAVTAFEEYKKTGAADSKQRLVILLTDISRKWADLSSYINRIRPNSVPNTLEEVK